MTRPTVAVWKFASCDGCQLTILDCEDELLAIAAALDFRMFLEAGPDEMLDHFDISLVEGSITTAHDAERIRDVRARSGIVVTIGACATAGGIQALRNTADIGQFTRVGYARPESASLWMDAMMRKPWAVSGPCRGWAAVRPRVSAPVPALGHRTSTGAGTRRAPRPDRWHR